MKVKMSNRAAVAVIVGAPDEFHLTLVNVAPQPLPDAGVFNNRTKLCPAVAVGIVKTHVSDAVNVAVFTVPKDKAGIVFAVVTVPMLVSTVSVYPVIVEVFTVGLVRVLPVRVCVAPSVTTVSLLPGKVIVVPSVPASVKLLEIAITLPDVAIRPKY